RQPLSCALRVERMRRAVLVATLQLYRRCRAGELPVYAALGAAAPARSRRATRLALALSERGVECSVVESEGKVGGGSLPLARLPGSAVALRGGADVLAALRQGAPPVLALLREEHVVLDVRCVSDVGQLAAAVPSPCERAAEAAAGDAAGHGVDPRR